MPKVPYIPEKEKAALIVIDIQNNNLSPEEFLGSRQFPGRERVVPVINKLISFFRERKMPIIWIITYLTPQTCLALSRYFAIFGPPTYYLAEGSEEAKIWKEFSIEPGDITVIKRHISAFFETDLDMNLRGLGIEYPCVVGCNTDQCVESTIRGACERLYKSITISDAVSTHSGEEAHEMALRRLKMFTRVMTSEDLMAELS